MPLNYSKWDQLELSDDSDIEGHPNVDKKSLIRLKQRDIHEKREARKAKIAYLQSEIAMNDVLYERLQTITTDVESGGKTYFSNLVEQLRTQPSLEAPPTGAQNQPTYDEMIHSLLLRILDETKNESIDKDDPQLDTALLDGLKQHVKELGERQEKCKADYEYELNEQRKKITAEDIHDGFDSKYKPSNEPVTSTTQVPVALTDSNEENEEELPELTPALLEFSNIPYRDYDKSWKYIQNRSREVLVPGGTDALLIEAFSAQKRGEKKYARQCVHQALLLQYCEKLGPDGVSLFFKRMVSDETRAQVVFLKDVEGTYGHIVKRVAATVAEEAAQETIQLMQEDPSKPITFNVPDGPPPEDLRLEGPGTENMDIEEVRKALQLRWDVFESFSDVMKEALKSGSLDEVNKVLGKMKVEDAEEVIKLLEMGGIMSLSDGGNVKDMTKDGDIGQ